MVSTSGINPVHASVLFFIRLRPCDAGIASTPFFLLVLGGVLCTLSKNRGAIGKRIAPHRKPSGFDGRRPDESQATQLTDIYLCAQSDF